jgi:aryl-alcohol dehydrogenase-like predicted oxidoreductase
MSRKEGVMMDRRSFLQLGAAALGGGLRAAEAAPMPTVTLGKSKLKVSRFTLGGAHMRYGGQERAVRIIQRALDLGVTFFDSAHLYNNGESDIAYGKALSKSARKTILLMGKAERRDAKGAMQQLEESLQRMNTDYLDLWQCHQVTLQQEVDQILAPGGALEAFIKAKEQGKVRHIGFTGHNDPAVHQRLLEAFDGWETVQHPVNLIDPHHRSFIRSFLPKARAKGLGLVAMKSNGMGGIGRAGIAPIEECLRFTLSQDIDTLVSGVETVEQLEQNVAVVKTAKLMSPQEIAAMLERTKKGPYGDAVEQYKREMKGR